MANRRKNMTESEKRRRTEEKIVTNVVERVAKESAKEHDFASVALSYGFLETYLTRQEANDE